jgi:uncharacterized phage protein gp47/JayE
MPTQQEFAQQMIQQLRVLDPSASIALGTPERKIIDTVAQSLVDVQVDLTSLSGALDLDSKFGSDLDAFLNLFGFGRQLGIRATGIVTFSREEESNVDIRIPVATQVSAAVENNGVIQNYVYETTIDAILSAGELEVSAPIRAIGPGVTYNVPANTVTQFISAGIFGITGITNSLPTTNGLDPETDAEYKVRFRNTIFRNLAGTQDQYLALAVAGAFTNKANVIGPISRYREYIQVPPVDDTQTYEIADGEFVTGNFGSSLSNEYTTSLSSIPYSEYTYDTVPHFVSDSQSGRFYTDEIDYDMNTTILGRTRGDALRQYGGGLDENPASATTRPNITFKNVYTGSEDTVQAARPGDIVLFEHSYISSASRNDHENNINNCVDIYINGLNDTATTTVLVRPTLSSSTFVDNSTSKLHFENYRRIGEPEKRPVLGNLFTPLFQTPITSVPDSLTIPNSGFTSTFYEGEHYWGVIEVSEIGGTIRARTGIEWSTTIRGARSGETSPNYTGNRIYQAPATPLSIDYTFDRNVADLQAAVESAKQVTTDVLVHKATMRYFKFHLNVMYTSGYSPSSVNSSINTSLANFLQNMYFGTVIQLSDILQTVHNVAGVDNVRWSHDVDSDIPCVTECNILGEPRLGIVIDRKVAGDYVDEIDDWQQWYITGNPTGGTYTLTFDGDTTSDISYNWNATAIQTEVRSAFGDVSLTVTGLGTPSSPFIIKWPGSGSIKPLITATSNLIVEPSDTTFITDFVLRDNELPALPSEALDTDTAPGVEIRTRAQNTWQNN